MCFRPIVESGANALSLANVGESSKLGGIKEKLLWTKFLGQSILMKIVGEW